MKQRFLLPLLFLLSVCIPAFAQFVPQGFNYQSIVRNTDGDPLANQTVTLLFAVRSGAPNGPVSYQEKQTASTNQFGLVNLIIGQGTALTGDFSTVNWGGGAKYLTVSIETSPNVFDPLGSSQLMSVPYALYAENVANGGSGQGDNWGSQTAFSNPTLSGNGTAVMPLGLAQQGAQAGQVLKWDGNNWLPSNDLAGSSGTVTQISTGTGLSGGPITTTGTISMTNSGVTAGIYGSATEVPVFTVNAQGRITDVHTAVVQPGTVGIAGGTGINVQQNGFNFTVTNTGDTNAADDVLTSSQADGDVSGPFSNLQIKANAVGSNEIANNAVGSTEISDNAVGTSEISNGAITAAKLSDMSATNGQVMKWNGTAWAPAADQSGNTTINAGTGISVTGTSPNFTVTNTGDTNAADDLTTASTANGDISGPFSNLQVKSDVVTTVELANNAVETANIANSAVTASKLDDMNASSGQVLKWNGTAWAPAADQSGSSNILAGPGISVSPSGNNFTVTNTGDLNPLDDITDATQANGDISGPFSNLQIKAAVVTNTELADNSVGTAELINGAVTGAKINNMSAGIGQVIKWNGTTWVAANDDAIGIGLGDDWGMQVAATNATLSGNGTAGTPLGIAQQGATNGQTLKWNGTSWAPANDAGDNWGAQVVQTGNALSGSGTNASVLNLAQQGATNGQVLKWNGSNWVPASDAGGNSYSAGTGISFSGSAPNLTINNTGDLSNTNEIQVLSISTNQLSLSNGGGTVTLPGGNTYTAGTGISITGSAPNFTVNNTGDLSNTNELQNLSLNGSTLTISGTNSSVDLSALGGSDTNWKKTGQHIYNLNTQNVLIGTTTSTSGKLQVIATGGEEAGHFVLANAGSAAAAVYGQHDGAGPGGYFTSTGGAALVTGSGNVGVGNGAPDFKLDVKGEGRFLGSGSIPVLTLENGGTDFARLLFKNNSPGNWSVMSRGGAGNNLNTSEFGIEQNLGSAQGSGRAFTARGNGEVTIGALSGANPRIKLRHGDDGIYMINNNNDHFWKFWVSNDDGTLALYNDQMAGIAPVGVFNLNGLYVPSDSRLKKDIMDIPGGILEKMLRLHPVSYRYIVENENAKQSLGFLAQDVQALFPELVGHSPAQTGQTSYLNLNYAGIGVLAVKAIQEQQTQIVTLKKKNDELRKRMDTLEARLERLEEDKK